MNDLPDNIRESNFDLLRIICTFLIIVFHLNGPYFDVEYSKSFWGEIYSRNLEYVYIYQALSNLAVSIFFMLTGAFVLSNNKNSDMNYFYKKSFMKIGVPTILFSFFYFGLSIIRQIINRNYNFYEPVLNLLKGCPFNHLWFMYTLLGVYLTVPFIIIIKEKIGDNNFNKTVAFYSLISLISLFTSKFELHWSISKVSCCLGIVFIGYLLKTKVMKKQKKNFYALFNIIICLLISLFVAYIYYRYKFFYLNNNYGLILKFLTIGGILSPLSVLSAIFLFIGFSYLNVRNKSINYISRHTFNIYLIHMIFGIIYSHIVRHIYSINIDCRLSIPIGAFIVFIMSLIFSIIYQKFYFFIDNKFKISNRLYVCLNSYFSS